MSHVIDGRMKVRDLDALADGAPNCGLELRRDQETFAWWGVFAGDSTPPPGRNPKDYGKCKHALGRIGTTPKNGSAGEWEIGLVPALDGDGYDLLFDAYGTPGRNLLEAAGPNLGKLRQQYAAAALTRKAKAKLARQGFTITREDLLSGTTRLKLRRR